MIGIYSYLLTFFGVIFWGFRVVVTLFYQLGIDFFATPIDTNIEIIVLFATLPCILLVIKRNIVGAAAYLGIYVAYFGTVLYDAFLVAQETGLNIVNSTNMLIIVIGVIIPLLTFIDILVNKNRKMGNRDKKADWFYTNKSYDRDHDSRDDRNQYKF